MECAPELGWPENWPPPVCGSAVARVAETLADAESRRALRAANRALMSPPSESGKGHAKPMPGRLTTIWAILSETVGISSGRVGSVTGESSAARGAGFGSNPSSLNCGCGLQAVIRGFWQSAFGSHPGCYWRVSRGPAPPYRCSARRYPLIPLACPQDVPQGGCKERTCNGRTLENKLPQQINEISVW
jgi:hypothetical protein